MRRKWKRFREDKNVLKEPECPFCRDKLVSPKEISTQLGFFEGGKCKCGAIYAYDASRKNLSEAFLDALSYACNEDWDLAMSLEPEKDYKEAYINYKITPSSLKRGAYNPFISSSDMVFVKVLKSFQQFK